MTRYELRTVSGSRDIALLLNDDSGTLRLAHVYAEREQYPLGTDRYYRNLPNLFVDILDLLDGNVPEVEDDALPDDVADGNPISLKTLTQRAAHAAADGSGNARRFKDARGLWNTIGKHVSSRIKRPEDDPIVDVRRAKNWKKNQPMRSVPADPGAWFLTGVYSRSNQRKNPVTIYRGLAALYVTMLGELDETAAPKVTHSRDAISVNLDYPTYAEIADMLDDSNMLVFHNDQSLADWIREQAKAQDILYPETPIQVHVMPDHSIEEDDPRYLPADSTMDVAHLANVLAPRA